MSANTNSALLVIDVQESFRHRPSWNEGDLPEFLANQQALIDGARARRIPVVQIFHSDGDGPFHRDSGHVRALEGLSIEPAAVFYKSRHSALVGTELNIWLRQHGVNRLIVSGIRTEQCCETTTRHASDLGYSVDFVTQATLTFAMTHASGTVFTAADIRKRTELVLAGRFARIATVTEALDGLKVSA